MKQRTFEQEIDHGLIFKAIYKVVDFQHVIIKVTVQGKEVKLDEFGLETLIEDIIDSDFDEREQIENDSYELL